MEVLVSLMHNYFSGSTPNEFQCMDPKGVEQSFTIKLEDVLAFSTGAFCEPPLGFHPQPLIRFHDDCPFPKANTCANVLSIPLIHKEANDFVYNMCFGILASAGFGRV